MSNVDVEVSIQLRGRARTIPEPTAPRIPRITRLMALAIKFQAMIEQGEVRDYADLARLGYVTRARLTQIMNLALLAPGLQEELLFATEDVAITERLLRQIIVSVEWGDQRRRWRQECPVPEPIPHRPVSVPS
jgi:hypothetical protein